MLENLTNAVNYRALLALALDLTEGSALPVLAMGLAPESTRLLHDHLAARGGRKLVSIEEDIFAAAALRGMESERHEIRCAAWDVAPLEAGGPWSVAILDHAPGERRRGDVLRLLGRCEIVVLHDTEPAADHGYKFSEIWPSFRSRADVKSDGAWSSAVSNARDLSVWRGLKVGPYTVTLGEDDAGKVDPTYEWIRRAQAPVDPRSL